MAKYQPWVEDGVEIHDHFDGSANCVQCGGPCHLKGELRLLTEMIRWEFERWARGYDASGPDMMQRASLEEHGVWIAGCFERAVACSRLVTATMTIDPPEQEQRRG